MMGSVGLLYLNCWGAHAMHYFTMKHNEGHIIMLQDIT